MPISSKSPWIPVAGTIGGGLLGVIAALVVQQVSIKPALSDLETRLTQRLDAMSTSTLSTPTTPTTTLPPIPVETKFVQSNEGILLAQRPELVGILMRKNTKPDDQDSALGFVTSVTADGWLMTATNALTNVRLTDMYVQWHNHAYEIQQGYKDTSTGIAWLKINANNLPVAAFSPADEVARGQLVFAEPVPNWKLETISNVRVSDAIIPVASETANRRFMVSETAAKGRIGMAIWDRAGRLVGITERADANGWLVIPTEHASSDLSTLIEQRSISRASLGIHALELSTLRPSLTEQLPDDHGAWLKSTKTQVSVSPTGPSAKRLQDGDIIQFIDHDVLDGSADLGEVLLAYRPGSTVNVSGLRAGKSFEAQITLGSVITSEALK